jgi:hypothetical protein
VLFQKYIQLPICLVAKTSGIGKFEGDVRYGKIGMEDEIRERSREATSVEFVVVGSAGTIFAW